MHAIVESGGKQYRVAAGDIFQVELLTVEEDQEHIIDKVIAIITDEGTIIGNPYLDEARVVCKVLGHGKGRKVIVFHYKPKKNIRKKKGHRQPFTKLEVIRIMETAAGEETNGIISNEEFSEEIAVVIPSEEISEEFTAVIPDEETGEEFTAVIPDEEFSEEIAAVIPDEETGEEIAAVIPDEEFSEEIAAVIPGEEIAEIIPAEETAADEK